MIADKLVEETRNTYVKERIRANPQFMERLKAKTAKMQGACLTSNFVKFHKRSLVRLDDNIHPRAVKLHGATARLNLFLDRYAKFCLNASQFMF